ncbi:NAD-dependent epimerase/dehydratase family protein [Flavobacterium circumlabens]|uniref:NAD-dependent epimerase/dehydratase family protein n=1 Tax=Flavobacterium circumlabens TaxID=2133765 RepID=A0A4Y7UAH9_9FLAO|nr:NAD-dependent epimerase/dehydratase family protein [Flavobacterium circumlabens]TCN56375.1 dTDP-L-rhamnose 4-epimerase [Flavobacterium circumlabens]TEB43410.1 NAD-dependent epimerase/dehydratase family protein [Flavobacterium circumlabens]
MKNILITGGAGFIGSNLSLQLINKGYSITVLDNLSTQIHGEDPKVTSPLYKSIKDKVTFIEGTVTSRADWEKALRNQDVVVHFAAETGTGQSMYCIEKYTEVNIQGTAIMLDILANSPHQVKKIVIASSRSIYGEGKYIHPELGAIYPSYRNEKDMLEGKFELNYKGSSDLILVATDEESKIHPSSVYGITKQNQEQMIMTVCPTIGIAPVAFRYQNVYGPGQSLSNPYTGILSIFSTQIRNNNPIQIFEDGKESRDFVFIDDVVQATILGIEKEEANGHVFNVGTGVPTDVVEVANSLIEAYAINVPVTITGRFRLGDIRHNYADLTKIKERLGFEPKFTFKEGIKKFSAWVLDQEIQEDKLSKSLDEMVKKGLLK